MSKQQRETIEQMLRQGEFDFGVRSTNSGACSQT